MNAVETIVWITYSIIVLGALLSLVVVRDE